MSLVISGGGGGDGVVGIILTAGHTNIATEIHKRQCGVGISTAYAHSSLIAIYTRYEPRGRVINDVVYPADKRHRYIIIVRYCEHTYTILK